MKKTIALIFFGVLIFYFIGPTPDTPDYNANLPEVPSINEIESFVKAEEAMYDIKPGNGAEIVWWDSVEKGPTNVAIVYLHGFTASQEEGAPTHREVAKRFGCNLYLARLSEHGLNSEEPLFNFTAEGIWQSAKEAYAIGKTLGKEVIIMSTSTGGTLALKLAATYPEIKGLINYSPNIEINDPAAFLLNDPWGLRIARINFGSEYRTVPSDDNYRKYWYDKYRLESVVELQELVETAATRETFEKVTCPVFNGAYYKDEDHQDNTVRVDAIRRMHEELGTPVDKKQLVEFPNAGGHVIAYGPQSGATAEVIQATISFLEKNMGMLQEKID
ncbi:alpha/beta hydrolase [Cryomorphaceae bacterium 1068]|nr:alpha/beta hydrolase [Cryomorphaceae bacterium 1068]